MYGSCLNLESFTHEAVRGSCVLCSLQADVDLLHSQEYLHATLQFAAHIQALTDEEHLLLSKSAVPGAQHDLQRNAEADKCNADVSTAYHTCVEQTLHCSWQRSA